MFLTFLFFFVGLPDEYYDPDFGIEVSGGGILLIETLEEIFLTFLFFFVGLPDEYYDPDFRIEVSGRKYY